MAYTKTVWSTGDTITATLANNWETQYDDAMADMGTSGSAHSADGLKDYVSGTASRIKATWAGSALQFEVDTTQNLPVQNALQLNGLNADSYQSASGTWTPASGTFNVLAGTVINIAAVPASALSYIAFWQTNSTSYDGWITGVMTSTEVVWTQNGTVVPNSANISSTTTHVSPLSSGNSIHFTDGAYHAYGYLQINNGYLQAVIVNPSGATSTYSAMNLTWEVD